MAFQWSSRPWCRHGEVSRAMRNRGVEIYLLPEPSPAAAGPSLKSADAQVPAANDLQLALAAAGVPGWALPQAMAATHQQLAAAAAAAHLPGPSLRQLRRWAELAGALAARGWPLQSALAAAIRQVAMSICCSRACRHPPCVAAPAAEAIERKGTLYHCTTSTAAML
jgi:hypothetical protein